MRIQATVEVVHRDTKSRARPVRTLIGLGKIPKNLVKNPLDPRVFLVLCTASNRAGIKFDVANNVQYSDDRYVNLGKCAIRFIKPAKTIFITDADPLLLKLLLKFLNKAIV